MFRRSLLFLAAFLSLGVGLARADGVPVLGFTGSVRGVTTLSGKVRYLTRPAGRDTEVQARAVGAVRSVRLPGRFMIPVVAYDGSPSGLSADGRTLLLVRPQVTFPQRVTHLAILDTRTLRVRAQRALRGDFSVDAISPNGRWIYLIQYTSRNDPTDYRVRALDTRTLHLLQRDIVDPHDRGEAMRGSPITRVNSADGGWAYTLYDGNGHPFVHALDTAGLTARCIDVPAFPSGTSYTASLTLTAAGSRLVVTQTGRHLAAIDTRTLKLLAPARAGTRRPAGAVTPERQSGGSLGMALAIVMAFLLIGVITLMLRRRLTPLSQPVDAP